MGISKHIVNVFPRPSLQRPHFSSRVSLAHRLSFALSGLYYGVLNMGKTIIVRFVQPKYGADYTSRVDWAIQDPARSTYTDAK